MATTPSPKGHPIPYAPTDASDLYPAEDGKPLYLPSPLMGFTLVDGVYVAISPGATGELHSPSLGLDFHVDDEGLGIYDPVAGEWLQTPAESASARAEREATRAEQEVIRAEREATRAEQEAIRAEQEAIAREEAETRAEKAEAEAAKLREEIVRLQAHRK